MIRKGNVYKLRQHGDPGNGMTVLVLSGVTDREGIEHFPYRPRLVLNGVGDIPAAAAQDRKDLVLLENDAG